MGTNENKIFKKFIYRPNFQRCLAEVRAYLCLDFGPPECEALFWARIKFYQNSKKLDITLVLTIILLAELNIINN